MYKFEDADYRKMTGGGVVGEYTCTCRGGIFILYGVVGYGIVEREYEYVLDVWHQGHTVGRHFFMRSGSHDEAQRATRILAHTNRQFERIKDELPSFSICKWGEVDEDGAGD